MKKRKYHKYQVGEIYGILELVEFLGSSRWMAKCGCGTEKIVRSSHLYRKKSCGCKSISNRFKNIDPIDVIFNKKYNQYKQSAKARDFEWDIDIKHFTHTITKKCHYCKTEPLIKHKHKNVTVFINGLDRIDNTKGYFEENIVPCCKVCNRAKHTETYEYFINYIKKIKEN